MAGRSPGHPSRCRWCPDGRDKPGHDDECAARTKNVCGYHSPNRGITFSPTISIERMIWSCVVRPIWNMKII
jgi:hypothetical protein